MYQPYLAGIAIGYLCGCLSLAKLMAVVKKTDITKSGTGNLGASNAAIHFGAGIGAAVALHDIAKSAVPAFAMACLHPDLPGIAAMTAAAAVLGHAMPFWNGFTGGKGFASYIGLMLASDARTGLAILACALIFAWVDDHIVAATVDCAVAFPVCELLLEKPMASIAAAAAASAIVIWKHLPNIRAIAAGTEPRLRESLKIETKRKHRKDKR